MKKYKNNVIAIILSIISVIFMWHKFLISGNSIIFILIFIAFYYFFLKVIKEENKRKFITSGIISVVFATLEVVCASINMDYTLNNIIDRWFIVNFIGYAILAWSIISTIYTFLEKHNLKSKTIKINKFELLSTSNISFFINMILMIVSWLPYLLRYYPGILTYDSANQISQILGIQAVSNHHPVLHTGLVSIFINIGMMLFNNLTVGALLYSVFQIVIVSVCFSIVLRFLAQKRVPVFIRILVLLYYMLYPVHGIYSITMWKDILFSAVFPILVVLCMELICNTNEFFGKAKNIAMFIITSLLIVLFRNNGIYIIMLTMPFILIGLKKYWKEVLIIFFTPAIIYFMIKILLFPALKIQEGGIQEMLSVPLQQIARVEKYHGDELDEETINEINKYFISDNIGEKYNPILSDPVKSELDTEYFKNNKIQFIKIWFKLLLNYPKDYIESFISNSYGYYYPEATYWVCIRGIHPTIALLGIEATPLIDGEIVTAMDSLIDRRDIPLISMFFSVGTAFWIIVISAGYKIYTKEYKKILIYLPIFILWLTIIASPVFCEFRYAYSMFTTLPLYIGLNFVKKDEE